MDSSYPKLVTVLTRYVSRLNAESVLNNALRRRGISPSGMRPADVAAIAADLERGISLFGGVDPARLRGELQTLYPSEGSIEPQRIEITSEDDVVVARSEARRLCEQLGASRFSVQRVATVVGELARNIASYTPGGMVELGPKSGPERVFYVRAEDRGSGISNIDEIMSGGYRSRTGLGLGLLGTKRLARHFEVKTGPRGTRVDVELEL